MSYQSILIETDGPVGILTLNRGDRHNAFDESLIDEITRGLDELEANQDVRVVVLSAVGKSFCAGADLNWMKRAAAYTEEENLADAKRLAELMRTLNELKKPTVARIQGATYGGGVGLVRAGEGRHRVDDRPGALEVAPPPVGEVREVGGGDQPQGRGAVESASVRADSATDSASGCAGAW